MANILFDGKSVFCMGTIVEPVVGREPPIVEDFIGIDAQNLTIRVWNPDKSRREEIYKNWRLAKAGLLKIRKSRPVITWIPAKRLAGGLEGQMEEERQYWEEGVALARTGDLRMVTDVTHRGFVFEDGSKLLWDGRPVPSPIRGWKCMADSWGGGMPCGTWTFGQMPKALEKRLLWLSKSRLKATQGNGREADFGKDGVSLAPLFLFKVRPDLLVFQVDEGEFAIATRTMVKQAQDAWRGKDGEAGTTAAPSNADNG